MTAAELIERAARQGVTIAVHDGALNLAGPAWVVHDLTPAIREAKDELLALLSGTAPPPLSPGDEEAIREAIEERAAIREFDSGEPREVGEREARTAMRVYRFRLTDQPDTWLTMLAPNCGLEEARRTLICRYSAERLEAVMEQAPRPTGVTCDIVSSSSGRRP